MCMRTPLGSEADVLLLPCFRRNLSEKRTAYNNPADFFLDLITVRTNPQRSNSRLEPVTAQEMLPDPAQLRAYYKHMQVRGRLGGCVALPSAACVDWCGRHASDDGSGARPAHLAPCTTARTCLLASG